MLRLFERNHSQPARDGDRDISQADGGCQYGRGRALRRDHVAIYLSSALALSGGCSWRPHPESAVEITLRLLAHNLPFLRVPFVPKTVAERGKAWHVSGSRVKIQQGAGVSCVCI